MDFAALKVRSDYEFKLDNFEGPLDLLLHLVQKAQINIRDIFVSKITEQYLEYMANIDELDVEKATDFLDLAATLVELKSDALLPDQSDFDYEDEDSPQEQFFRMFEEFAEIKKASEDLKKTEDVNRFYKVPDESVGNLRVVLRDTFTLDGLLDAFSKLLLRIDDRKKKVVIKEIKKDPFTVEQKIEYIREKLFAKKEVKFFDLFSEDSEKSEVITTFQALLELMKEQIATCEQYGVYEDITIKLKDGADSQKEEPAS